MSINPLNDISKVYLEQVAAVEEGVRPGNVETPLDKAAFKKRRRSLAGKEKSAEARGRGHQGKEWYNSGRTYSPDEAKRSRANMDDEERRTRHRSAVDPDDDNDNNYSVDKTKNPKKLRKQKAMGESAVPGKPAERLGAVTTIPKSEQDAARERVLAKAKAMREKKGIKEEDRKVGGGVKKGGGYERGYEAMKREIEKLDKGEEPATRRRYKEMRNEALDPVGKEDADIDNDGDTDKSDKYLHKRRKAIRKAIGIRKEALDPVGKEDNDIDNDGDSDKSDKYLLNRRKVRGAAISKKSVKEGYSNWREDLSEILEVVSKDKGDEKITEKTVKNKIKINPNLGEAVESLGGTLLEMVEVDEVDYIVESVYDELLEEGYEEDDIEEALEFALTEAKVTFGHDTDKPYQHQKKSGAGQLIKAVGRLARQKLSSKVRGAKKEAGAAVVRGARKVAKGALGVARKIEGGDTKPSPTQTQTRSASTYRGAGAGQKERVSSGSYTPPTKKKAEKPADPWKGSSTVPQKPKPKAEKPSDDSVTTPPKAKKKKADAPKAKTTKVSGGTAKAPAKKKNSGLDDLLASIRSEQVQIDEKTLTRTETKEKERLVKSMKDKAGDFEKRYPGRGKEVMYATATKMAKKIAEQAMEIQPKTQQQSGQQNVMQRKTSQQKDRQKQQEVQILQRKLQALRSAPRGVDTDITA